MKTNGWPKYFYVDNEMYVKLHVVDGKVVGTNDLGSYYDIGRLPLSPFKEITQEEFEIGAKKRREEFP